MELKAFMPGMIFDELNGTIYFIKDPDGHILEILPPN